MSDSAEQAYRVQPAPDSDSKQVVRGRLSPDEFRERIDELEEELADRSGALRFTCIACGAVNGIYLGKPGDPALARRQGAS